ncbi:DNA-binding transcriptional regulator, LysR family [Sanguibacter gelidistatuariae]|uniref:DNA-binding transcriptional regulator, LysR family n=1 Tax=Sanguibacter gelidistatuariae TaxID=1814289 RepID=A0A1G6Q663_9MICO|nr:LysR family transcriptional regulator [Sanguibacter gelidistatuariae]SDC87721.1 DNA-binding transcriptional regulator, LysR family [Sanguibacter gelidistatuariae]
MDLRQMEYLVALADEQQFTRAAAVTGVSQSGLSAAIRSLESELNSALFTRTTRRVEPTAAGLALLPYARSMLAQATAARDAVVQATHEVSGTLHIGSEQCLGVIDVPPLLERFHRRFPQVEIRFTQAGSHELLALVREDELDVAFVATTDHLGSLSQTILGSEPLVLLCPPEHRLAERSRLEWSDLTDENFIDFHASWGVRPLNDSACDVHGIRRRVRFTVNDVHTLLDLVDRGLGIALVPQHIAAKPQAARLISVAVPEDRAPRWVVSVVAGPWDRTTSLAPHLLELLDDAPACRTATHTTADH